MTDIRRVLFVHHSVGRGILVHGRVRERLAATSGPVIVELTDHDYNRRGITWASGQRAGQEFPIPDDDTDPPGLRKLLETAAGNNVLRSKLEPYDLMVVKSCFPNSRVKTDEAFDALKETYQAMLRAAEHLGMPIAISTTPPVRAGRIACDEARRAAAIARWLVSNDAFVDVFDLFGSLADLDEKSETYGMLRSDMTNPFLIDSHPTRATSRSLGEPFAQFLSRAAARTDVRSQ